MINADKLLFWSRVLFGVCVGGAAIFCICRWILLEIRIHRNNRAPVETCGATVLYLHPETAYLPQDQANGTVYYATFRTDSGWDVTVYMTYEHFYALQEGDRGQLTHQGTRFWKFVPTP